jgi:phospholipid/cholesterol/gamma-HCH transport system substrate-binding protein
MFKTLRYIDWSELSGLMVGAVLAISLCIVAIITIKWLQRDGFLGRDEYNLYCDMISGQGLHKGTTVQINGVDIGSVGDITLTSTGFVRLTLVLDTKYKEYITNESVLYATRDQNIISERVVNIDVSHKGGRILEEEEFLKAGTAQDIETVLKTANELVSNIGNLVAGVDSLLNLIVDTSTTVGMLLGSRLLYDRLDTATISLNKLLGGADKLLTGANSVFKTINDGIPKAKSFADTLSSGIMGLMGSLDNLTERAGTLINSLDTTVRDIGSLVADGSQTINKADDFIGGMSKFWFIRNKIPQKDSIPLLEDAW